MRLRNVLLSCLVACLPAVAGGKRYVQDYLSVAAAAKAYQAAGWEMSDHVLLDLNRDGLQDCVMALRSANSIPDRTNDAAPAIHPRKLVVLYGRTRGFRLYQEFPRFIGNYAAGIQGQDPFRGLEKKKHTLIIRVVSGGSSGRQDMAYEFRETDRQLVCTGMVYHEYELPIDRHGGHITVTDYEHATETEYDLLDNRKIHHRRKRLPRAVLQPLERFDATAGWE